MPRPRRAELQEEPLGDGSVAFCARITVGVGDRRHVTLGHSREGMDREGALTELRRQEARVALGQWTDPSSSEPTGGDVLFHVFASQWYMAKARELSERGAEYLHWALTLHLLPFFGDYRVNAIDLILTDRYKEAKLAERDEIASRIAAGERVVDKDGRPIRPLSNASINKTLEVLSGVLRRAVKYRLIAENPAADEDVWLPARKPRRTWLMPDQVLDLLDAAERIDRKTGPSTREKAQLVQRLRREAGLTLAQAATELGLNVSTATYYAGLALPAREPSMRRAIIATLALSGVRASELCALRWRDIDFTNRRITVSGTKSDAAERVIKIADLLRQELLRWRLEAPSTDPDALVFPTATESQRDKDNLRRNVVAPALREANRVRRLGDLPPITGRISPHALRRTFVALMLAHGNSVKTTQVQAGHADARTTLNVYAQVIDTDFEPTRDQLTRLCTYSAEGGERVGAGRHRTAVATQAPPWPTTARREEPQRAPRRRPTVSFTGQLQRDGAPTVTPSIRYPFGSR